MRVAFINQPWVDSIGEPKSIDSMALWTYEVARRLTEHCDVVVYIGRKRFSRRVETFERVEYRCIPSLLDRAIGKLLRPFSQLFPARRPLASASVYAFPYAVQIALDLRKQHCDIVHIHFFLNLYPSFERLILVSKSFYIPMMNG